MKYGAPSIRLRWAAAVCVLTIMAVPVPGRASRNLLNNGDLLRGADHSVDGWRTDAWVLTTGTTEYDWIPPYQGEPAELEILSHRDNDARWVQIGPMKLDV